MNVTAEASMKPADQRQGRLALAFQEMLTAVVRLRASRQSVTDAELFRAQVRGALKTADQEARALAYTEEDIRLAIFAVVAFLDETILNLQSPAFADWVRKPMQEELFGQHTAGEIFFNKDATVYITALLVFLVWFLLFRTTWGLKMRAVGENPAADIHAAAQKMGRIKDEVVHPIAENQAVYDRLYAEYKLLYDYFGRGQNDVMKRLRTIKAQHRAG